MFKIQKKRRQTIVTEIGQGSIRLAAAEAMGEACRFQGLTKVSLDPGMDLLSGDLDGLIERLSEIVQENGWVGAKTACLLSQHWTGTHTYFLPPMPEAETRQAIELKLRDTLHFDLDEAVFDYRCVEDPRGGEDAKVLMVQVVVARKDALVRNLELLRGAGLQPVSVSAASESLANLTHLCNLEHQDEASAHIYIGEDTTVINLFDGDLLRFSREIDVTGSSFAEALTRPILTSSGSVVNLEFEQAERILRMTGFPRRDTGVVLPYGVTTADLVPVAAPVAQKLTTEIRRSIDYLNGLLGRTGKVEVVLSGPAGAMPNLDRMLEDNLQDPVTYVDPVRHAIDHWRLCILDQHPPEPAGFSAVLGHGLGGHVPLNLLSLEAKADEERQRATREQRVRAGAALILLGTLATVALPLDASYAKANRQAEETSLDLDRRIVEQAEAVEHWVAFQQRTQGVAQARGPVPYWTGVMKEVNALIPESVQVIALHAERSSGPVTLRLVARIHPGMNATRSTLTGLTQALNNSPFFDKVRVLQASVPIQGNKGRFEATFEVLTPPIPTEVTPS